MRSLEWIEDRRALNELLRDAREIERLVYRYGSLA